MMADKKVDRYRREHSLTPSQKMRSSLSDTGTMNMAEPTHDKGKSALVDKFRQREERWRAEQARHDHEAAQEAAQAAAHEAARASEPDRLVRPEAVEPPPAKGSDEVAAR